MQPYWQNTSILYSVSIILSIIIHLDTQYVIQSTRLHTSLYTLYIQPSVTAKWFLSTLCKHIKAISDCGSSSLTIWLYSSSVSGGPTGFTGIHLLVPPQTEGNLEEEQLIDSVSTHPVAGGTQGKLGGARGADWKTKHDSARGRYGTVKGWRVGVSWDTFKTPQQCHPCRNPSPSLA